MSGEMGFLHRMRGRQYLGCICTSQSSCSFLSRNHIPCALAVSKNNSFVLWAINDTKLPAKLSQIERNLIEVSTESNEKRLRSRNFLLFVFGVDGELLEIFGNWNGPVRTPIDPPRQHKWPGRRALCRQNSRRRSPLRKKNVSL